MGKTGKGFKGAGKAGRVLLAATMAGSVLGAAPAYAAEQTGSGVTSLMLTLKDTAERGGTAAEGPYANPDTTGDGLGDNLAFTVPTRIDFIAAADGTLEGPAKEAVYIENESKYGVHVSSLQVKPASSWNIVADASASQAANSVDMNLGPAGDSLNAANYLAKANVEKPAQWNMAAQAAAGTADRVQLEFAGHISNVDVDLTQETAFGQINWYVTPGMAS